MTGKNAAILIVDDEPTNIDIIKEFLLYEPYELYAAIDGLDAWTKLISNPDKYDLILLDRMMPKLSGLEVLAKIKSHPQLKSIPVILQTAKASTENIIEGMSSGAYYYLTKPFNNEMLSSIVKAAIEDKFRYELLRSEVDVAVKGLATLQTAHFEYKTIDEANHLAKILANTCAEPDAAVVGIAEILINAVEHGNLDIGYDNKTKLVANNGLYNELCQRIQTSPYKDRVVQVDFNRDGRFNTIVVEDQGLGFNWQSYLDFDPERAFDSHGRGIATAKLMSIDEIKYHGCGNKVVLTIKN